MELKDLIKVIERFIPDYKNSVTDETLLTDLGLSSLDMMILICEIEKIYKIDIDLTMLKNIKTVKDFYAAVMQ